MIGRLQLALILGAALALSACEQGGPRTSLPPQARPERVAVQAKPYEPSQRSIDLARYYVAVQNDLLTQGLLRTDGGGPDTPFTVDDLIEDFETIVFYQEYSRSGGINYRSDGTSVALSRWTVPVRLGVEFGDSVPEDKRKIDQAGIDNYAQRLARITGHSIFTTRTNPNFHVFVAGEDDRTFVQDRLRSLIPSISQSELELFGNLPRSFYCLVVSVAGRSQPYNYAHAVALIRAEHPDLVRLSCIHEEIAQGLGMPNDSPHARPSIFNDDDEFALLTSHDELLLKMLYDPRLQPGMSLEEARPIIRTIATELMGEEL
ncbi:DUF2927 domain-containing protein [Heliomarina baculiformis]|uniref:DUF2927 domain-containing protein n=1 Tax=Heliomarina baculiformis TaxID=2872036 RepID=UPI001EE2BB01|nr:DUF2927 domain-containing protein [Heliomarina baculiformis]